jgi:hypothetical protein
MHRKGNDLMPRIKITRNTGPRRIGQNCFYGKRWGHETLPQYNGRIATRRRLHLFWLGPIFVVTIPEGKLTMPDAKTVTVTTKPCPFCGKTTDLELPYDGALAYQEGALIQKAFPDMDAADRERLITGTCGPCWDETMKGGWD